MANERARCLPNLCCADAAGSWPLWPEPPSGFGRILIIASAGLEPGAGAAIVTIPVGAVTVSAVPDRESAGWAACGTHRQGRSAILANVTTHAITQLEAGVPVHLRQRPEGQLQKANVPPDQVGCDSSSSVTSSPSSRSAAHRPLASQSGRPRWWARQTIPRGRVHADPRFDALAVSMTSPRGGGCCLETTDLTDND
jgi:hypothetical protein